MVPRQRILDCVKSRERDLEHQHALINSRLSALNCFKFLRLDIPVITALKL